ncbi:MAG: hypothetical protein QXJ06_06185 [Candidatus Aenigmatarchaeota archaeon]
MLKIEELREDFNLFLKIHLEKYRLYANRDEFIDDTEMEIVFNNILDYFIDNIIPEKLKLKNLSEAAKTEWFSSIEFDYYNYDLPDDEEIDQNLEKTIRLLSSNFPFLPEDSLAVLVFAGPALDAYGLPRDRFMDLLEGKDKCTEIEEHLITWAFNLTALAISSIKEKNKKKRQKYLKEAIAIASEELNEAEAQEVVNEIIENYQELTKDFGES